MHWKIAFWDVVFLNLIVCPMVFGQNISITISESEAAMQNKYIRREFIISKGVPQTIRLVNNLTGKAVVVQSDEFSIILDSGKCKLRIHDFSSVRPPTMENTQPGSGILSFNLIHVPTNIEMVLTYWLGQDDFYMRKKLTLRAREHTVDMIAVEQMQINAGTIKRFDISVPFTANGPWATPIGRPLYMENEFFLGLEYPAGYNQCDEKNEISLRHYPGKSGEITSKSAVIGVAPNTVNNRIDDWFGRYIDRIRAHPLRRYVEWIDYCNDTDDYVREMFEVAQKTFTNRGVQLDAALVDGGWEDPQGVMVPHRDRPHRLELCRELSQKNLLCNIGLHINTHAGRTSVDEKWLGEQGFDMIGGKYYCGADPRIRKLFTQNLVDYIQKHDVVSFKFDWGNFNCDRDGHRGHRAGLVYGREAITDAFLESLHQFREVKPDIFLYNTGWYSPWWLMEYDAVFSSGGDYNYSLAGPPAFSENDALCSWRDGAIIHNVAQGSPFFPLSSLMNVDPITSGWHDDTIRRDTGPLERFSDYLVMSVLRGCMMTEIYMNILNFTDEQRDVLAKVLKWQRANDDILLSSSRWILGDPLKNEVYGYSHFKKDNHGLIGVRNPGIDERRVNVRLDESLGVQHAGNSVVGKVIYPYRETLPGTYSYGDSFTFELQEHEVKVFEFVPTQSIQEPIITKLRYSVTKHDSGKIAYKIYSGIESSDTVRFLTSRKIQKVVVNGNPVQFSTTNSGVTVPVKIYEKNLEKIRIRTVDSKYDSGGHYGARFRISNPFQSGITLVVVVEGGSKASHTQLQGSIVINGNMIPLTRKTNVDAQNGNRGWSLFWIPLAKGSLQGEITLSGWTPALNVQIKILSAIELPHACSVGIEYAPAVGKETINLPENWNSIQRSGITVVP